MEALKYVKKEPYQLFIDGKYIPSDNGSIVDVIYLLLKSIEVQKLIAKKQLLQQEKLLMKAPTEKCLQKIVVNYY